MNVLILSPGQDTGGQAIRMKEAFNRHAPDWRVRAMNASKSYIKYPADLQWDPKLAAKLYGEADVVHHKNGLIYYDWLDKGQHKPTVVHHHGTRLRDNARAVSSEADSIGATQLVSTVDLLDDAPGSEWLPTPYDLDGLVKRYPRRKQRVLRIGHAPTNRLAKGTEAIKAALGELAYWHEFEFDLIENVEWRVCLSRKAMCDIYIDQLTLGYGNNSVEAWAWGIPVVSAFADPADRERFVVETGMTPQFYEVDHDNLVERLRALIVSEDLREEWGQRGRTFAEMFHADNKVVDRLKRIYSEALPTSGKLKLFDPKKLERFMEPAA